MDVYKSQWIEVDFSADEPSIRGIQHALEMPVGVLDAHVQHWGTVCNSMLDTALNIFYSYPYWDFRGSQSYESRGLHWPTGYSRIIGNLQKFSFWSNCRKYIQIKRKGGKTAYYSLRKMLVHQKPPEALQWTLTEILQVSRTILEQWILILQAIYFNVFSSVPPIWITHHERSYVILECKNAYCHKKEKKKTNRSSRYYFDICTYFVSHNLC